MRKVNFRTGVLNAPIHGRHAALTAAGCLFMALVLSHCTTIVSAAGAETSTPIESPIAYRRIFVPAANVEAWPRDGEKYIPVEAHDFEAWVVAANQAAIARGAAATIDAAEYVATLENDGRFHGHGQWTVSFRGDKPSLLPLGRLSFAVREPRWQSAAQQPVRLGVWAQPSEWPSDWGWKFLGPASWNLSGPRRRKLNTMRSKSLGGRPSPQPVV